MLACQLLPNLKPPRARSTRYRLRHQAEAGHRGARIAAKLLERPDRLIGAAPNAIANNAKKFSTGEFFKHDMAMSIVLVLSVTMVTFRPLLGTSDPGQ